MPGCRDTLYMGLGLSLQAGFVPVYADVQSLDPPSLLT